MQYSSVGSPLKKTDVSPTVSTVQHDCFTTALSAETTVISEYMTPRSIELDEDKPPVAIKMSLSQK